MAENSKGGILNKTEKFLRRRKTKVLQSLGKTGRTTDEQIQEDSLRLEKQQEIANKFQKDLRHYIHTAKALALASKAFYTTLQETYETEWEGHAQVQETLTSVDVLWQDYLQKLQEQIQDPLTKYLSYIPQIKARVAKRGRKLIDYDNAKHNLDVQQNAKKKDEAKISKAQEDCDQAKRIYEELNNELHTELPEFYNSRVTFYGNAFQHMFEAEHVFHQEIGKGAEKVADVSEKLSKDNEHLTYTPRKNLRYTISHESDEHMPNGHSENGNSGYESPQPDSPGPSATPSKAPEPDAPGPSPAPRVTPVKADITVENGEKELDTSKESVEEGQGDYENADLSQQQSSWDSAKVQEVKVTEDETAKSEQVTVVTASETESVQSAANITVSIPGQNIGTDEKVANENAADESSANEKLVDKSSGNQNKDLIDDEYINVASVAPVKGDQNVDDKDANKEEIGAEGNQTGLDSANLNDDSSVKEHKEPDAVKIEVEETKSGSQISEVTDVKKSEDEQTDISDTKEPKEEPKVNGEDLDTSGEPDIPDYPPPQPPTSEPPTELKESPKEKSTDVVDAVKTAADDDDDDDANRDSLYQVPPPAKPLDDLPPGFIKTVIATHPYKGEDDDELTFESGEVIYCVSYDDPEEQGDFKKGDDDCITTSHDEFDPGWLMGVRKLDNKKGVFPENFTKPV